MGCRDLQGRGSEPKLSITPASERGGKLWWNMYMAVGNHSEQRDVALWWKSRRPHGFSASSLLPLSYSNKGLLHGIGIGPRPLLRCFQKVVSHGLSLDSRLSGFLVHATCPCAPLHSLFGSAPVQSSSPQRGELRAHADGNQHVRFITPAETCQKHVLLFGEQQKDKLMCSLF